MCPRNFERVGRPPAFPRWRAQMDVLVAELGSTSSLCPCPPFPPPRPFTQVFTELGLLVDATPVHQVFVSAAVNGLLLQHAPGVQTAPADCSLLEAFRLLAMPPAPPAEASASRPWHVRERELSESARADINQILYGYIPEPVVEHLKSSHQACYVWGDDRGFHSKKKKGGGGGSS